MVFKQLAHGAWSCKGEEVSDKAYRCCYDFVITQAVIRQSFDSTFIFGLRYKVYSGKAKLQF